MDDELPASIAAEVGRAALPNGTEEPPRRKRGRPPGVKNKPAVEAAEAAPPPPIQLDPAIIARVASGTFQAIGKGLGLWLGQAMLRADIDPAQVGKFRDDLADVWRLEDDEATAIGKATADYVAWLNVNMTPGWALAIAVTLPLAGRGLATYGMVRGQNRPSSG